MTSLDPHQLITRRLILRLLRSHEVWDGERWDIVCFDLLRHE